MNYKTPGVYVEEISLLPPSVAQVETAIPAFIGYVEYAAGLKDENLYGVPTRVQSMAEYRQYFGGPSDQVMIAKLADTKPYGIESVRISNAEPLFQLYAALELYFANGGGPCYIVAIGNYADQDTNNDKLDNKSKQERFIAGLDAVKIVDEVTLLVTPEALTLDQNDRDTLYQQMLVQAGELQDRFAILDVPNTASVGGFRDGVGTSYLNYGAAYCPLLQTTLGYHYTNESIIFEQDPALELFNSLSLANVQNFSLLTQQHILTTEEIVTAKAANLAPKAAGYLRVVTLALEIVTKTTTLIELRTDFNGQYPNELETHSDAIDAAIAADPSTKADIDDCLDAIQAAVDGLKVLADAALANNVGVAVADLQADAFVSIYSNSFEASLQDKAGALRHILPPSPAMAGLYARTDNTRGVWKAPANISVQSTSGPVERITHDDQESLNVHTTGKSINAIRSFSGRGTLVWGARTLAGNDNEWRYVPVRRFFNLVEESVQKATEAFVFEPNNANTWVKVKAMIENYLTILWRQGAMMGTTPEEAFFVHVGLGETMTSQDVLEGRMIVEIGMAAVRPAEFIILRFSHFLQEA